MAENRIYNLTGISYPLPEKKVLLRLGCNLHLSRLDTVQKSDLKLKMLRAFALCRPTGRFTVLTVAANDGTRICCENGFTVESGDFAKLAAGAEALWVGAVTVGGSLESAVASSGDMAFAAVGDAVGSECADLAMAKLQDYAAQELKKSGLLLDARRFSPGYGDMSLEHQRGIFDLLQLEELGLQLTKNNFIIPEKSVSAFAALRSHKETCL